MVHLTRIYTRTGDDGTTALGDLSRTHKTDERLAAYADIDEASCAIGVALATANGQLGEDITKLLLQVQNDLYDVGADLCTPLAAEPDRPPLRITPAYVAELEQACDRYNAELTPLRSFVLPGGTPAAAQLHVARTVTRRAERSTWAAIERHGTELEGGVNRVAATYLNRLSDLLFVLCRYANRSTGDAVWTPGGHHQHP
jgi:cob(I)alamin adenosyltransferase